MYTEISGVEILYYPIAWCAETLLHYQICSYVTDAEIIEYLLGMSNNAFTLSELEVWLVEISHVRLWRNWQTRWI